MYKLIIILICVICLFSCAAQQARNDAPATETSQQGERQRDSQENSEPENLEVNEDVLYGVLAGETSGFYEDYDAAADLYYQASLASDDPAIAERATRFAQYLRNPKLIAQAVARWIELDRSNLEAHQISVSIALMRKDSEAALRSLRHVLALDTSDEANKWAELPALLASSRDAEFSSQLLDRLFEEGAENGKVAYAQSQLAVQFGNYQLGHELATTAVELEPEWLEAWVWRARIRSVLEMPEASLADYRMALSLDSADRDLKITVAGLANRLDDHPLAQKLLSELEQDTEVLFRRAAFARASDNPNDAELFYQQLVELATEEDADKRYFLLGQLSEMAEQRDLAINWYQKVPDGDFKSRAQLREAVLLSLNDQLELALPLLHLLQLADSETAVDAYLIEAELEDEQQRSEQAMDIYTRALAVIPDDVRLLYARAMLAERMDLVYMAEDDLRRVVNQQPNDATALNALGYTLADRTDRYEEALELINRAYQLQPTEPAIVDSMGWVHYRLGNYEQAINYLKQANELDFNDEISAHLGEALWVSGEQAAAEEVWQRALEQTPDSEAVNEAMQRLKK